ncbi:hypothetical protein O6H91_23G016800 [Diphasiastrum complanatum]|uniref:Uncharacterized protein n=1 Tax=Diphasiastrum complanatum TaxID=34168 RepID=A0ACC2A8G5_DIPCM|nr:hypothetical protein O6H91_23G016800 [Diphasiastrum complanatum]
MAERSKMQRNLMLLLVSALLCLLQQPLTLLALTSPFGFKLSIGSLYEETRPYDIDNTKPGKLSQRTFGHDRGMSNSRRLMIGSMAPTCTYNECRGCQTICKAEPVPIDSNDPRNSAYHYRCVCRPPYE